MTIRLRHYVSPHLTLRSLMDQNHLMLVIASRKELSFYSRRHKLTSSFFNLGHTLRLGEFTKDEVKDLFDLSANTIAGAQVSLSVDEQHLMQKLGGNHPFLLQLVGSLVWEAWRSAWLEAWCSAWWEAWRSA